MNDTRLNMRVDETLKAEANQLFSDLGMSLTTAVTIFLEQSVRDRGLPFKPSLENPVNVRARRDTEEGNVERFSDVEELLVSLNA
ncbi:MAG: type II toxin-antitoxin system RelB/DinJ family antitoxin [Clostridiales Family XIII bacterium]|nr:type II toxin-antitoxin system RelB/DinJ family antitoxin [Clostridiales Family XIII bacterium]